MRIGRWFLVGMALGALARPAPGQLLDAQFKVPDKPEPFNEKTMFEKPMFPEPAKPKGKLPPPLYCGGLEFGLAGSDGNSDVLNLRFGGRAKRETDTNLFTTDLLYGYTRQAGKVTANKALWNLRDEGLFRDTPWGLFLAGQLEYDQFRAYDFRVATHTGFAHRAVEMDWFSLRTRLGAGFSREIGGPTNRYVPEGLVGGDLQVKITARQRFLTTVDFYPDLGRVGQYRLRTRAAYEILIDPDWGLTLRMGVQDRYDSNPGPSKRNDVDYFGTLMFKF